LAHLLAAHPTHIQSKQKSQSHPRKVQYNLLDLTIFDKPNLIPIKVNHLGQKIRELREKKALLLRQVAAHLEVDTALMSKVERGERNASKQQVISIAGFLKADEEELLTLWLADKIESTIVEEPKIAYEAMKIANKNLKK
jgi:transcriptional regulator with XRE-family HTH domain